MQVRFNRSAASGRRGRAALAGALLAFASLAMAAGVADLGAEFDKALQRIDGAIEEQRAEMNALYVKRLREIQTDLEAQGQVRGAVAVFDEISRSTKAKTLPPLPAVDPVELHDAQLQFIARSQQVQYSNEMEVVRLASRCMQALAQARAMLNDSAAKAIDEERNRILALPRLRAALKATAGTPPDVQAIYASATNSDLKYRSVKLTPGDSEALSMRLAYDLQLGLAEDDSKLRVRKSTSSYASTHSEDGVVVYKTRFTVAARGDTLPAGCRIMATYYSRSLTDRERKRETTESIDLPTLERGQSYTLDGQGLSLVRSYSTTASTRGYAGLSVQGQEWYGLVVDLLDPEGRLMLHRCSPQSLERELERDAEKSAVR